MIHGICLTRLHTCFATACSLLLITLRLFFDYLLHLCSKGILMCVRLFHHKQQPIRLLS